MKARKIALLVCSALCCAATVGTWQPMGRMAQLRRGVKADYPLSTLSNAVARAPPVSSAARSWFPTAITRYPPKSFSPTG